jgi:hypothetical protein
LDILRKLVEIASTGIFELITMLALGILLLVFLFVPSFRKTLGSFLFRGKSQVESTGHVIEAISGLVIIILLFLWVFFGK